MYFSSSCVVAWACLPWPLFPLFLCISNEKRKRDILITTKSRTELYWMLCQYFLIRTYCKLFIYFFIFLFNSRIKKRLGKENLYTLSFSSPLIKILKLNPTNNSFEGPSKVHSSTKFNNSSIQ